jgi:tetratricopeptide (TPR) repeat protein
MGGLERYNLANLYLLMGLHERANAESLNARMLDKHSELQMQPIGIALATFRTVTDIETRRKAVRHAFNTFRDLANNLTGNIWQLDVRLVPWVYFNLGTMGFELLEFATAQRAFETCISFRYCVHLSLQWLALVHFRCGAFEEAEGAYWRLRRLFPSGPNAGKPPVLSAGSHTAPGTPPRGPGDDPNGGDDTNDRPPGADPAAMAAELQQHLPLIDHQLQLAFAANHTAAAFAEQGLVEAALERWNEGKACTRGWLQPVPQQLPDGKTFNEVQEVDEQHNLKAARSLSRGAILLAAGVDRTDLSKVKPPFEVPGTPEERLKQAIRAFRDTVASALEVSIRADAFYRTAVACLELADLETDNAATWRRRAEDATNRAESSDRRGEYVARIASLRKSLKPST